MGFPSLPHPQHSPTRIARPAAATREVELKLHLPPEHLTAVASLPALVEKADGPATVHLLRTVYYDTPDLRLFAAGIALRVRQEDGRFVQTLKTVNSAAPEDSAAVAIRREWEWPVSGETPDLSLLAGEAVAALVPAESRGALVPLFTTEFRRTALLVRPDPLTAIEVAVDQGFTIAPGAVRQPISEVELELKAGRVGRLFDLALVLQRAFPVRIGTESKAEVGLRLVTGRLPAASVPEPLGLSPLTTVAEAYRHIVRHGLRHLLANEACVLAGGESEGLHQMRVALRRLRTAHRLFSPLLGPAAADRQFDALRGFAKQLGPARGYDVLLAGLGESGPERRAADPYPDGLAAAIRAQRAAPAESAREAVSDPRCTGLILELGAWLEAGRWHADADPVRRAALDRPVIALAGGWLAGSLGKVRKAAKPVETGRATAEQRNRLRRKLRSLRYAAEFFHGLYPEAAAAPFIAATDRLLAALDADHDAAVAHALLRGLPTDRQAAKRAGAALCSAAARHRRSLPALWRGFAAAAPFWA